MTSTTTLLPGSGPVPGVGLVAVARAAVSQAVEGGLWSRSDTELAEDVRETLALRAQVDALLLAQLAEVDARGMPAHRGCPSTRAWLRSAHRVGPGEASALVKTAIALRDDLPAVGAAFAAGDLSQAQAQVCVHAIADLPQRLRSRNGPRPRPR